MTDLYCIDQTWRTCKIDVCRNVSGTINFDDKHVAATLDEAKRKLYADLEERKRRLLEDLDRVKDCILALETDSLDIVETRPPG